MATLKDDINSEKPVLVYFFADWSADCITMSMIIKEFKRQVGDKLKIVKLDVDKHPKVVRLFKVKSVPTFIIFRKGKIKWQHSGEQTVPEFLAVFDSLEVETP